MKSIQVQAQNGTYDVVIDRGLLSRVGTLLSERLEGRRALLVCDDTTADLYSGTVTASLKVAGFDVSTFVFPHGEANKRWNMVGEMLEKAASANLTRSDFFIALGGGVCGDMTGFAAAVYLRGVPFVQIPTTLLAAVDASVGGKTGVDLGTGKNLAGAFHQPACVLFDPDVIATLPKAQIDEGKAEIIKHAVLAGGRLYEIALGGTLLDDIEEVVALNVEIKRSYVQADPFDTGCRQLLNFGHTIGHAIEKCSGYTIPHGQAVAMGMVAETKSFIKLYNEKTDILETIQSLLEKNSIKFDIPYTAQELAQAAIHDKKMASGNLNIIAPLGIGNCQIRSVPASRLEEYIEGGL
ncbi:MAG: 3-dehydroquinate synthase [Spirochaetales bacterium]|nr:3-dehydroquinate synthase [Spirochaetales bacterium]